MFQIKSLNARAHPVWVAFQQNVCVLIAHAPSVNSTPVCTPSILSVITQQDLLTSSAVRWRTEGPLFLSLCFPPQNTTVSFYFPLLTPAVFNISFLSMQATDWHNKMFQAWDDKWVWYSWSGFWSYVIGILGTSVCKCILWFYQQILRIFSSAQHIFTLLHSCREGLLRIHLHPDPLKHRFSSCEVRGRLS